MKSHLRDMGFKWNPFRKEWYGYGDRKVLEKTLQKNDVMIDVWEG